MPFWTLIEVGNDHRLADPESLDLMIEACKEDDVQEEPAEILQKDWTGLCYTAVLRWAEVVEDNDWVVVHGTVLSEKVGKRIQHAWCECRELIVDLAMPVGSRIIERKTYYKAVKPEVSKVYSCDDALKLAVKNRHDGPWDESEQLRG